MNKFGLIGIVSLLLLLPIANAQLAPINASNTIYMPPIPTSAQLSNLTPVTLHSIGMGMSMHRVGIPAIQQFNLSFPYGELSVAGSIVGANNQEYYELNQNGTDYIYQVNITQAPVPLAINTNYGDLNAQNSTVTLYAPILKNETTYNVIINLRADALNPLGYNYSINNGAPQSIGGANVSIPLSLTGISTSQSTTITFTSPGNANYSVDDPTIIIIPTPIKYTIPITLTNGQSVGTPANFQQMITFNALAICNAIICAPHLNNTEFFFPNGTLINSWYESANGFSNNYGSNTFSTSNGVTAWVLIPPANYIPASGSNIIYLGFASNAVNLFSNTITGEGAWLTATNGIYDNGDSVFGTPFYNSICPNSLCQALPTLIGQFNGATSYIYAPGSSSLALNGATVCAWVKTAYSGGQIFALDDGNGYYDIQYGQSPGELAFNLFDGTNNSRISEYPPNFNNGEWQFVCGVRSVVSGSTSNIYLYQNGASLGSLAVTIAGSPGGAVFIGSWDPTTVFNMNGIISNVQIYNAPLSPAGVNALYAEGVGGLNVQPANAVSQWQLNGNANDNIDGNGGTPTAVTWPLLLQNANTPGGVMPTATFGSSGPFGPISVARTSSVSSPFPDWITPILPWVGIIIVLAGVALVFFAFKYITGNDSSAPESNQEGGR